ncbi:uncharacterized protein TEOVI_000343200 [Trypanosoma equiperdum]|uniref:Uncharacterized protein n=2 Tax=Trypanozoon TaxID=39700 RepID=Q57ZP8_TRYB2|nr:hypothetical protein, conserved [Trypanosoma brucei brucei TREU927]AAX79118.1 hypothetical protein, conserved [Trypanosoma brucei]AAZ11294.1 hypothetical protein, conserved [Trypanosoma brucei brucei TREU927]SCU71850.1 hypothetical protein, conserved [Trypanosoma equiperdum]
MFRRAIPLLSANIPRSVWDPAQHNPNWSDSYGHDITNRRAWPARKWTVGLEPCTPREWLQFSHRNLAYAYNGALRACHSLPSMLLLYKEMKQRGVKVDVDTMNVLLTRAARHEHIQVDDVFLLFDELVALGARPDLAAAETLHTVLSHSASMPEEWREARRLQLVELYNNLAMEEVERLAPHRADRLLKEQMKRFRGNLQQLGSGLRPTVYCRYLHTTHTAAVLLEEVHNFLWELVPNDHPAMEIPALQLRVPFVASVLRRPSVNPGVSLASVSRAEFGDTDVCAVFLAAAERMVDADFDDQRPVSERRLFLSLLTMISYSGVLYTSDLMAQLMEMVKYSNNDETRDSDAQRVLRYALRGSSAAQDSASRTLWHSVEKVADCRVVGRYIGARNPWNPIRVCFDEQGVFKAYPISTTTTTREVSPPEGSSAVTQEQRASCVEGRTLEALNMRWDDVRRLIECTGVLVTPPSERCPQQQKMEVFTGMAVYLRTVATGRRYEGGEDVLSDGAVATSSCEQRRRGTLFAEGYDFDVWVRLFSLVQEVRHDMEKFMADHTLQCVEPEFECWEALLVTLRCALDFCVVQMQGGGARGTEREVVERLFRDVVALREELIEESRTRFGGRMRVLWLQEA